MYLIIYYLLSMETDDEATANVRLHMVGTLRYILLKSQALFLKTSKKFYYHLIKRHTLSLQAKRSFLLVFRLLRIIKHTAFLIFS